MTKRGDHLKGEIEIKNENKIFENKYVDVYNDQVIFPSSHEGTYIRINCKPGAGIAVVPITPDGKIVFIKNYRHGIRGWGLEVPKGAVEIGETFEEGAKRELMEETGFTCKELIPIGEYSESPAIFTGKLNCFIAEGCVFSGRPTPEKTEAIANTLTLSVNEFFAQKGDYDFVDAISELLIYKHIVLKGGSLNE